MKKKIFLAAAVMTLGISAMAAGNGDIGSVVIEKFNPNKGKLGIVCKLIPGSVQQTGNGSNIKKITPPSLMNIFVPSTVRYDKNGSIKLNVKNKEVGVGFIDLVKNDLQLSSTQFNTMNYNRSTVIDSGDTTKATIKNIISIENFSYQDFPEQAGITETHLKQGSSTVISNVVDFEGDTSGKNSFIYNVESLNLEIGAIGPEYACDNSKCLSMAVITYNLKSKYQCNHDLGMF